MEKMTKNDLEFNLQLYQQQVYENAITIQQLKDEIFKLKNMSIVGMEIIRLNNEIDKLTKKLNEYNAKGLRLIMEKKFTKNSRG